MLITAAWIMHYSYRLYLLSEAFALPGLLIRDRSHKIMAILIIVFAIVEAIQSVAIMNIEYGK